MAVINGEGEVTSFILKSSGREFAAEPMNHFLLYKDVPRYFDAWDIDSIYENEPVELEKAAKITLVNAGPYKAAIRLEKQIGNSSLIQIVSLSAGSRRLEFDTTVEWRELHRLLKVGFPVRVHTEEAIHETQFGYVKRPAHRSRVYDKDRFEVCNHRYTAMRDGSHGAAVLNNCKYGVSALGNEIRLTLLRAEASPEMRGDNRSQRFVYAFTAWNGTFMDSSVVREGYELNAPLIIRAGGGNTESFFGVDAENIILDTVKPAGDQSCDIILRLYESKHADCECALRWNLPVKRASITNMAEDRNADIPLAIVECRTVLSFRPFEVKTIRLWM
jgi:alpha-mannosidase